MMVDIKPQWWGIMSHNGGYRAMMVEYHEHDGGYQAMLVEYHEPRQWSIMSHNGGYRAMTVEYHEPRRWIPNHNGGVS